ncbi:putative ribonuclease H-like domain-containing protein [Tanacetum coccineum]
MVIYLLQLQRSQMNNAKDYKVDDDSCRKTGTRTSKREKITRASSTNSFNTVSTPVNTASASRTFSLVGPSSGPSLGLILTTWNHPTSYRSLIPTLEYTPIHPKAQILGIQKSAVPTRGMTTEENSGDCYDYQQPKISQAHDRMKVGEAIAEELLQFKIKEGIDYDEVFAPVARVEAIRKFLAFASFMNFPMYQMDVKSSFLYGTIKEESRAESGGIFISQDKYVGEILKKFGFSSVRTASTPMEIGISLTKDEDGEDVDVHLYRSMIGSLMYLTSFRPDIMFLVCACSRFQVQPKVSYLNAVKRIFRYLKGQPKLGLWYPKDSPLTLEAFLDSDYAGASLDKKFTTAGCQFLGLRLISWLCKKQTMAANSTTEAEYIDASHCCGQVLWIQNQMLDYGFNFMQTKIHVDNESAICVVKNPVYHFKTKHIEIMHHFIRDSYKKRLIKMVKIHTDNNVADLLTKAFDVSTFNFLVASIGRDTKIPQSGGPYKDQTVVVVLGSKNPLGDVDAQTRFEAASKSPMTHISQELTHLEVGEDQDKIITKASIRRHLKLQDSEGLSSLPNAEIFEQLARMGYATTSDIQPQGEAPSTSPSRITSSPSLSSHPTTSSTPTTPPSIQITHEAEETATMPHDSPLPGGHITPEKWMREGYTSRSREGNMQLLELINLCIKLSDKVTSLKNELASTKAVYNKALITLTKKVNKLEKQLKHKRRRTVIDSSEDEGPSLDVEDSPKQGRMIDEIDKDENVNFVKSRELGKSHDTAEHRMEIEYGDDDRTLTETLLNIKRSAAKGKAIMQESEPPKKIKKKEMIQIIEAQWITDEERIPQEEKQTDEREKVINWNDHDVLRYHAVQNRPFSKAEVRKNMCTYLKNQGGYKMSHFKGMNYEDIRPIFERVWDQNQAFVPKDSKIVKEFIKRPGFDLQQESSKKTGGSMKKTLARKRAGEKQSKEDAKRQKTEYEKEKEELKAYLDLVPREEFAMEIESLGTKYPIVDWKTHVLTENFMYYQIIRADGGSKNYKIFSEMLDDFDRQDVMDLHRLVEERYATSRPEGYDLMLWGDLKILFQPDEEDEVWRHQHEYNLISWRLFDSCGIHILLMDNGIAIHMMIEKKYPLTQEMLSKMLSRKLEVDHENEMAFELLREITSLGEDCWELNVYILSTVNTEVSTANTILYCSSLFKKND